MIYNNYTWEWESILFLKEISMITSSVWITTNEKHTWFGWSEINSQYSDNHCYACEYSKQTKAYDRWLHTWTKPFNIRNQHVDQIDTVNENAYLSFEIL
jgi:hypothetical protein